MTGRPRNKGLVRVPEKNLLEFQEVFSGTRPNSRRFFLVHPVDHPLFNSSIAKSALYMYNDGNLTALKGCFMHGGMLN